MRPGQSVQGLVLCHGHQAVLQVIVLGLLLDNSVVDNDQLLALLNDRLLQGMGVTMGIRPLDFLFVTKIPDDQEINMDLANYPRALLCHITVGLKVCFESL